VAVRPVPGEIRQINLSANIAPVCLAGSGKAGRPRGVLRLPPATQKSLEALEADVLVGFVLA
jgi:hypothetical protein